MSNSLEQGPLPAGTDLEALSRIELVGARRLSDAWPLTPHFYLERECLVDALLSWRKSWDDGVGGRPSVTSQLVWIVARVLREHPRLNSHFSGEVRLISRDVGVGVAIATEAGLVVSVVHGADELSLLDIHRDLDRKAGAARAGVLRASDLSGGTFTITNLGTHGVDRFWPVINPPQAGILAVGRIRPVIVPVDGLPAVRTSLSLVLAADHRVVDGATAAGFLGSIAARVEQGPWM